MMADCAAMFIDVITYLFNFLAERLKHSKRGGSTKQVRLRRLYLELVPPSISVTSLLLVIFTTLREAFTTILIVDESQQSETPDLTIMVIFSALNLLLDVMNVGCFARVDQMGGFFVPKLDIKDDQDDDDNDDLLTEITPLVGQSISRHMDSESDERSSNSGSKGGFNLNMCSAWSKYPLSFMCVQYICVCLPIKHELIHPHFLSVDQYLPTAHVAADTLRSTSVLLSAGLASLCPNLLSPASADSYGAILVSIIILISLIPLLQGIVRIYRKIQLLHKTDPRSDSLSENIISRYEMNSSYGHEIRP